MQNADDITISLIAAGVMFHVDHHEDVIVIDNPIVAGNIPVTNVNEITWVQLFVKLISHIINLSGKKTVCTIRRKELESS